MKTTSLLALVALTAASAFAQLAPPNGVGVTLGHIHLSVKDVAAQEQFLTEMIGGTIVKNGPLSLIQFPGVYIMLRKAEYSGPPAGSVVDHFGFVYKDLPAMLAHWKAAGVEIEQGRIPTRDTFMRRMAFASSSSEIRHLPVAVRMDHIHSFTTDIPGMQSWYSKVFGGIPGQRPRVSTPGWVDCDFMPGNITLSFMEKDMKMAPTKGRSLDHIGFEVKDLDAFAKKLQALGINFDVAPRPDSRFEDAGRFPNRPVGHLYRGNRKPRAGP